MKYTKEILEPLVRDSQSVSEVLRKLTGHVSGGAHAHLTKRIKSFEIDTSHFLGQASFCGQKSHNNKRHWSEILVKKHNGRREQAWVLRRALIECGREYKCERCPNTGEWLGEPITLQVDHKNSDWTDHRPENLAFMCPNCHTQTPNWCGSKGKTKITTRITYEKKHPAEKYKENKWRHAPKPKIRKTNRPPYDQLITEVKLFGYSAVGRKYNVSDNAIRKWIKWYEGS